MMNKIILMTLMISSYSMANLEKMTFKKKSSHMLKAICSNSLIVYKDGKVDSALSKQFFTENKCKGFFLGPRSVLGVKKDFPQVKCDTGEAMYVVAVTRDCIPKSLNPIDVMLVKDLEQLRNKWRFKRPH